jgi:hypothetical protein
MPYQRTEVLAVLSALQHYHNTCLFAIFLSLIGIILADFLTPVLLLPNGV